MKTKTVILEESTNTHTLKGNVEITKKFGNTVVMKQTGKSVIMHGTHGIVSTEIDTKHIVKITQQEYNPITKQMMNAID